MPAQTAPKTSARATKHQSLQPPGWPAPKGYANGIKARGEFVFVGGMVGWDANEKFPKGFRKIKPYLRYTPQPNKE